jgi:hypothetical protein
MRLFALALVIVLAGACEADNPDAPDVAQRKAECRRLLDHIFRITPQAQGGLAGGPEVDPRRIEQLMARVPVEDIEQCAAVELPSVIACMQAAPDVATLRACIPAKQE